MSVLTGALASLNKERVMADVEGTKGSGTPPLRIVGELQEGIRLLRLVGR